MQAQRTVNVSCYQIVCLGKERGYGVDVGGVQRSKGSKGSPRLQSVSSPEPVVSGGRDWDESKVHSR